MFWFLKLLTLFYCLRYIHSRKRPFNVLWNVPSEICSTKWKVHIPLSKFNIGANDNDSFFGDVVNIFYKPTPGLYPHNLPNGTFVNGGLPQMVNLTTHLRKAALDIKKTIGNESFRGVAVIDWESWVPIFDRNEYDVKQRVYLEVSEYFVRKQHPDWNTSRVKDEARKEFQSSARKLMQQTVELGHKIRPGGQWGFYGFPRCYNYVTGHESCSNTTKEYNDELCWIFNASSVLYPSIYLNHSWGTPDDRRLRVKGILNEALRVKRTCSRSTQSIYAYSRFRYSDTEQFYTKTALENTIRQAFDANLDGVVLWDSTKNFQSEDDCVLLQSYVLFSLGPFVRILTEI